MLVLKLWFASHRFKDALRNKPEVVKRVVFRLKEIGLKGEDDVIVLFPTRPSLCEGAYVEITGAIPSVPRAYKAKVRRSLAISIGRAVRRHTDAQTPISVIVFPSDPAKSISWIWQPPTLRKRKRKNCC